MQLGISKCYLTHKFHWSTTKLYEKIGYHDESNCLLEYYKKLVFST